MGAGGWMRCGWAANAGSRSSPLQGWVCQRHEFESNRHAGENTVGGGKEQEERMQMKG